MYKWGKLVEYFRARGDEDRSLYVAVLSSLWEIVRTVVVRLLWSAGLECRIARAVVSCQMRTVH
jgi:hypothetical protein